MRIICSFEIDADVFPPDLIVLNLETNLPADRPLMMYAMRSTASPMSILILISSSSLRFNCCQGCGLFHRSIDLASPGRVLGLTDETRVAHIRGCSRMPGNLTRFPCLSFCCCDFLPLSSKNPIRGPADLEGWVVR